MITNLRFEPSTRTIRSVPENYWIATVKENKTLVFDSWDGAIKGKINKPYIRLLWFLGFIGMYNGLSPHQIIELNEKIKGQIQRGKGR